MARFLEKVSAAAQPEEEEEEEEELEDPHDTLRAECRATSKCTPFVEELETCTERVNSRKKTTETCMQELMDMLHCVDHCVAKSLFQKLK
uniref:cytochrome b-c1 complex subunit 6, mitochondrial n=1 Tax=Myxine glutinosa TaxID=7769 RepID=UPI00358EC30E